MTRLPMRPLRDIPIHRKLTIITLLTSGLALLLASVAFATYEWVVFRATMVSDLSTTAAMIADNSSAALAFDDAASAEQTLRALNAHPHVVGAAVYDAAGNSFAKYERVGAPISFDLSSVEPAGYRFEKDSLKLFHDIDLAGERAGTVYIQSDLTEMPNRLCRYALIVVVVMLAASFAALLFSRKLHATISGPISHLAEVVAAVGKHKDYAMRATKQSKDELGQLIDGFNEMLGQIQARDRALAAAHRSLEQRVEDRTRELQLEVSERRRAEEALRAQEERTRLIVDKAFDAIISADADGIVIEWNAQAEILLGWSRAEALGRSVADTIIPPRYRGTHRAGLMRVLSSGENRAFSRRVEIEALRKDGREIPIELAITPIRVGDTYVFNAFLRDLTERKKSEADLAEAHRRLVDISRQAGMADVATSVLHNVGNVLNSVNVSTNMIVEHIQRSKISSLARLAALLREREHDLVAFVGSNQGRHLVPHVVALSEHLLTEQTAVIEEVESLRASIEHIKDIVTMQQACAKISGIKEVVDLAELVEDSLRLNADALQRHGIEVVRRYEDRPVVNIDKHKVLQILVNLVRNAIFACDESRRTDKRVTLRVVGEGGLAKISVVDNGIGIAPENLTRIFSHGFTTRKDGHGFGLHSGALAARELGGTLSVHSDGIGQGALFTLELILEATGVAQDKYA